MKNTFKFLIAGILLAFGTVASAALIIEFDGAGGETFSTYDGGVEGSGINIDSMFVTVDGIRTEYQVDSGILSFDTGAGEAGEITIVGIVDSLGVGSVTDGISVELFNGAIDGTASLVNGFSVFTGTGGGEVPLDVLTALDENAGAFSFYAFTLGINEVGTITTDITASQLEGGLEPPAVPVPAAVWLFGSGLIGLVGVARRKPV